MMRVLLVLYKLLQSDSQILTKKIHWNINNDTQATSLRETNQDWNCLGLTPAIQPPILVDLYLIVQRIHSHSFPSV